MDMTANMPDSKDILNIIYSLFLEHPEPLNQAFIFKEVKKRIRFSGDRKADKKLRDRVAYYLSKLEEDDVITRLEQNSRFVTFELVDPKQLVDLMLCNARPKLPAKHLFQSNLYDSNADEITNPKVLFMPKFRRFSNEWFNAARHLLHKPPSRITEEDKEILELEFWGWKQEALRKALLFRTQEGEIEIKDYETRFTSENRAKQIIAKYNEVFTTAKEAFPYGVFLTVTLPGCIPLRIQQLALSFLMHRIKAYVRKKNDFTPPHIKANEPQKSLSFHTHVLIFGISFLMPKQQLTRYLDRHLENFLENLGEHYRRTLNNRATDEQIKALNKYGKRLLKKYRRWKHKKRERAKKKGKSKSYEGPVNFVTRFYLSQGSFLFQNLPPDVQKHFEKSTYDGANITVEDYVRKYIIKNVSEAKKSAENPEAATDYLIAWYWLLRTPFFTCSPSLRPKKEKPPPAGWEFIGSYYWETIQEIFSM